MLLVDFAVRAPHSHLKDSTVYPTFFISPAMNPRTAVFCRDIFCITSTSVASFSHLKQGLHHDGCLAALSALADSACSGVFGWGFPALVAFLLALATGATSGAYSLTVDTTSGGSLWADGELVFCRNLSGFDCTN
jgi:hypothetical protein